MDTFVSILHIVVALILIGLVLIQDTKSGSVGGAFGGGGSNSVLGTTGAASLAQKLTRWAALIFAITSLTLTFISARSNKSVVDTVIPLTSTSPAPVGAASAPSNAATASVAPAAAASVPPATAATPTAPVPAEGASSAPPQNK